MSIFLGPLDLPTVAQELESVEACTGLGLLGFELSFVTTVPIEGKADVEACTLGAVRTGSDLGVGEVTGAMLGLLGRFVSRKISGNFTLLKPRAAKPGSAGVVSIREMRVDVDWSRLKGSRTGR